MLWCPFYKTENWSSGYVSNLLKVTKFEWAKPNLELKFTVRFKDYVLFTFMLHFSSSLINFHSLTPMPDKNHYSQNIKSTYFGHLLSLLIQKSTKKTYLFPSLGLTLRMSSITKYTYPVYWLSFVQKETIVS